MIALLNHTKDAISDALYNEFGDDYTYYTEQVQQGLKKPCFIITYIEPHERSVNASHYYRTMPMAIYYHPKDEVNKSKECNEVAERAAQCLEYIVINDGTKSRMVRGVDISWDETDGILLLSVTYNFWTEIVGTYSYMEDLKQINKTKK